MDTELAQSEAYNRYIGLVRGRLSERKAAHTVSVAEMMRRIAPMLGLDTELCITAGMLHDLCRTLPADELLRRAQDYGLPVTEVQEQHPMLLHGPVAAEECRRDLGLDDEDLYEAIYFHTTGRPFLGGLGQALYLADFSEPLRKHPEAAEARALLDSEGFEKALLYAAEQKYAHVREKKHEDPETAAFFAWLKQEYA